MIYIYIFIVALVFCEKKNSSFNHHIFFTSVMLKLKNLDNINYYIL